MSTNEFANTFDLNHLLRVLPRGVLNRLKNDLELIDLELGLVLYDKAQPIEDVYFPTTAIVSILHVLKNEDSAEIAIVGNDGMLGIFLLMSERNLPGRTVIQIAGQAYKLKVSSFKAEFYRVGSLFTIVLRYMQALITQMAQTAVCNRHHTVEQQLCRWLLLSLDRSPSHALLMTHKLISNMLGVRREGVTEAAGRLQAEGFISYKRGSIDVLNRKGLETLVCECYPLVRYESEQLLGGGFH